MTECTQVSFDFPLVKRRRIEARFSGGDITSDGGLLLLRQADRRLGLLEAVNARLPGPRDGRYVRHDQLTTCMRCAMVTKISTTITSSEATWHYRQRPSRIRCWVELETEEMPWLQAA